ncbi:F52C9.6 [Symbiodinium sp. CCMP2456]|nr:F52C9.6 [Symbiodinium sp. CCMP2456]
MSSEEIRLAQRWYDQEALAPSQIAQRLGRDKLHHVKQVPRKKQGRRHLTEPQVDQLLRRPHQMIVSADAKYHVTVQMLRKAAKTGVSERIILEACHRRGGYFRKLREKPLLAAEDIRARFAFAKQYKDKSASWWNSHVHAFLDGQHFKTYLTSAARKMAAQHRTFGAYRVPGRGLSGGYVKPKRGLAASTRSKSSLVMGAIGKGRLLLWHAGQAAADLYVGPLKANDPTGFQSNKGKMAKCESGISTFAIPTRSPDLNPMDFCTWSEINRRFRRQEAKWSAAKRETRPKYLARLRRTARKLPESLITSAIGDMEHRCQRLFEAKGHFFEESGA